MTSTEFLPSFNRSITLPTSLPPLLIKLPGETQPCHLHFYQSLAGAENVFFRPSHNSSSPDQISSS